VIFKLRLHFGLSGVQKYIWMVKKLINEGINLNIQYHMITAAAHIKSLGEMRLVDGLTNSAFIQLYVNELADMLHIFTIECKHGGKIKFFLPF